MKKLTMILVVLALLMAFPAAAGAKKPPPGQEPFPGQHVRSEPLMILICGTSALQTATSCCLWKVITVRRA